MQRKQIFIVFVYTKIKLLIWLETIMTPVMAVSMWYVSKSAQIELNYYILESQ